MLQLGAISICYNDAQREILIIHLFYVPKSDANSTDTSNRAEKALRNKSIESK